MGITGLTIVDLVELVGLTLDAVERFKRVKLVPSERVLVAASVVQAALAAKEQGDAKPDDRTP